MTYDLIDKIYEPTGQTLTDDEGNKYPEMAAVPGYHVNMLDVTVDVSSYEVAVNTPSRVFAGRDDAVHLKFANRAEWLALGIETVED